MNIRGPVVGNEGYTLGGLGDVSRNLEFAEPQGNTLRRRVWPPKCCGSCLRVDNKRTSGTEAMRNATGGPLVQTKEQLLLPEHQLDLSSPLLTQKIKKASVQLQLSPFNLVPRFAKEYKLILGCAEEAASSVHIVGAEPLVRALNRRLRHLVPAGEDWFGGVYVSCNALV